MGRIAEAIIIANEQRILGLRERLNERIWHPDDPMKAELEGKLAEQERSLRERLSDQPLI